MHRFLPIHQDIHELLQDADLWILNESFKWWAHIASQLPGRTDSEIKKNFWNSHLKKRQLTSIGAKLQINHSSSPDPINIMCESPSSCHMVQWESARVEAEARLSMQSLLVKHTSTVKGHPDIFIQLWNSEVGEAFRNINGKDVQTSESPVSDTRPCVRNTAPAMPNKTSTSIDTTQEQEDTCKPSADVMSVSDSIGSNELEILQIQH